MSCSMAAVCTSAACWHGAPWNPRPSSLLRNKSENMSLPARVYRLDSPLQSITLNTIMRTQGGYSVLAGRRWDQTSAEFGQRKGRAPLRSSWHSDNRSLLTGRRPRFPIRVPLKLVHVTASRRKWKWKGKSQRKEETLALVGLAALAGTALAGFVASTLTAAISFPIMIALGFAGFAVISSILAATAMILLPLVPILFFGAAFAVPAGVLGFSPLLFLDQLLCVVLLLNFLGAVMVSYWKLGKERKQAAPKLFESEGRPSQFSWGLPSVLSLVPGINGTAWIVALSDSTDSLSLPRRAILMKNAALYSMPGLLSLCKGAFVVPAGAWFWRAAPLPNLNAWWLALILGAVHLQLERGRLKEEAAQAAEIEEGLESGRKRSRSGRGAQKQKLSKEAEEELLRTSELEEFDARLRQRAGTVSSAAPKEWSTGDVMEWLKEQGFARYAVAFVDQDVDGRVLLGLSAEELRDELGVRALGDRKRLLEAIAALRSGKRG